MNLLDIFVENYDFTEPIEDEDILVLWTEIRSGVQLFKIGENALYINSKNYAKIYNFLSEGKQRKLFDESEITKFEKFIFSLKKFNDKTSFQSSFSSMFHTKKSALNSYIDSVYNGKSAKFSLLDLLKREPYYMRHKHYPVVCVYKDNMAKTHAF
jgi:hypothetical protein